MWDYAGSGSRLDDLTYTKVFPYQQTWQGTVVDAPTRLALERGGEISARLLSVSAKKA
jgi:hypothetical protein